MPYREKFTVLRAKIESTEFTDPTTVAGDEVRAWGLVSQDERDAHVWENTDVSLSPQGLTVGAVRTKWEFSTYFMGLAAVTGTAAASSDETVALMTACGFPATFSAGVSVVHQRGASTGNGTSVCLEAFEDGRKRQGLGARGDMTLSIKRGVPAIAKWSFMSRYSLPTPVALPATDIDNTLPAAWLTTNLTSLTPSGGSAYNPTVEEITIALGNKVSEYGNANHVTGVGGFEIVGGETSIAMKVLAVPESTQAFYTNRDANTPYVLSCQVGTTANGILTITAPVMRIRKIGQSVQDGLRMLDLDFLVCRSSDAGNNELVFTRT